MYESIDEMEREKKQGGRESNGPYTTWCVVHDIVRRALGCWLTWWDLVAVYIRVAISIQQCLPLVRDLIWSQTTSTTRANDENGQSETSFSLRPPLYKAVDYKARSE